MLALFWIAAIVVSSDGVPWWLSPILLGLLGAIPLSVWGSRVGIGRALRRRGLLVTPEELRTPTVLQEAARAAGAVAERLASFKAAVLDAACGERALAAMPERAVAAGAKARAEAGRIERAIAAGPGALARDDKLRLLSSRAAMQQLQAAVRDRGAHPDWWLVHEGAAKQVPEQDAAPSRRIAMQPWRRAGR